MNRNFFSAISMLLLCSPIQANFDHDQLPILDTTNQILSKEGRSLLYLTCGLSNLIAEKYQEAHEDCEKALSILDHSEDSGIEFLALFSLSICCDNLQRIEEYNSHMIQLRNLINQSSENDQENSDYFTEENNAMVNGLLALAQMSASKESCEHLTSFLSELFPIEFAASFEYVHNLNYKIIPCKSVFKKFETLIRKLRKGWDRFYKFYKEFREVETDIRNRFAPESPQSQIPVFTSSKFI